MPGPAWWQRGAIYQVYPRSFADSDGDGIGDLRGIAQHVDHLRALHVLAGIQAHLEHVAWLGADALWLSPFFRSPMADFGYDVSDYCDVDPIFGTLDDFDALVATCHADDIRVIIDWVPNHTSDQHPWFQESRAARDSPKRDWYVWRDPAPDGGPPNDWRSTFEAVGPAWTKDDATGQYYLHSFLAEQPDLNWDNPDVQRAMHDTLRFWLDRGVDGFRLDAIVKIAKDPLLRDNAGAARRHDEDWDTIHDRLKGIRAVVDEYPDRVLVGETVPDELHRIVSFLNSGDQLHLAHNFFFLELPWEAEAFRTLIADFERLATDHAWPAWVMSNHDVSRVATRYGGADRARAVLVILYALRGTPFIYQGEELGLPDAPIPPDRVVDVDGRDPERVPIPWDDTQPNAGFGTGDPWLPTHPAADRLSVRAQEHDDTSTLTFTRRLAALRAATPALQIGTDTPVDAGPDVLAWRRDHDGDTILAAVNFGTTPTAFAWPGGAELLLASGPGEPGILQPAEAVLLRVRG
jgi:alpha-glucosidase